MTQDEKYTEQFKKGLNEYIELGFNQDECNGFMHGFHKGAEAKQLILSGVVSSFLDKEAKNLGVNRNYLYLHMVDDKLYLEEQNDDDYHFGLRNVREVE